MKPGEGIEEVSVMDFEKGTLVVNVHDEAPTIRLALRRGCYGDVMVYVTYTRTDERDAEGRPIYVDASIPQQQDQIAALSAEVERLKNAAMDQYSARWQAEDRAAANPAQIAKLRAHAERNTYPHSDAGIAQLEAHGYARAMRDVLVMLDAITPDAQVPFPHCHRTDGDHA